MSAKDRILASFESLVGLFTKRLPAAFVWSYRVESAEGLTESTFTGRRVSPDCPFDDVVEIPLMPGIAGAGVKPAVGSVALVAFVDGDPGKPHVVGWDQTVPQSVTVDAETLLRLGPSAAAVALANGGSAVFRTNDLGDGGTLAVGIAPATLAYVGGDGTTSWTVTLTAGATPVTAVITPVTGVPGKVVMKAGPGSSKVTCG